MSFWDCDAMEQNRDKIDFGLPNIYKKIDMFICDDEFNGKQGDFFFGLKNGKILEYFIY